MTKAYLGDGVYVDVQNDMFMLTTEDGISVTNTIYLEPQVYNALVRYVERAYQRPSRSNVEANEAGTSPEMGQHRGLQDSGDV